MTDSLSRAKELMEHDNYTCVIIKDKNIYTSVKRGVKPLLDWLDEGADMRGASASDKVVGKAAAYIYVKLQIKELYTGVLSLAAKEVLERYSIAVHYGELTDAIINRTNTGFCPMETAVMGIDDTDDAIAAIKAKLESI